MNPVSPADPVHCRASRPGRRSHLVALLIGCALVVTGALVGPTGTAAYADASGRAPLAAKPSGGADPDTPGTSASVSPRTLEPGGTISYRVSGFPAGEIVNIKVDDGDFCSQSGVHGACVVAQQRIPASGTVTGSLVLPPDLALGSHWLRFLASEEVTDADGAYLGVKGYTARGSSDFTVVEPSAPASSGGADEDTDGTPSTTDSSGSAATTDPTTGAPAYPTDAEAGTTDSATAGSTGATAPEPGAVLTAVPPPGAAAEEGAASTDQLVVAAPPPQAQAAATATAPVAASVTETGGFPYVGLIGLVALLGLAVLVVVRGRRVRG